MQDRQINPAKKLWISLGIMVIIFAFGTAGYEFIEGWSFLDSLYMTAITLTTVGFGEIRPLSDKGVVFTLFLIACGMSLIVYTAKTATALVVEGEIQKYVGRQRMKKSLAKMKDHFIICGFGRIGQKICEEFTSESITHVVIERDEDLVDSKGDCGVQLILGEATSDPVLLEAGIERARGLITAVNSPADNVFITLTARQLNPDLLLVARAETHDNEQKLYRAGANKVIFPHSIGGRSMAMAALRPSVDQFMDPDILREKYGVCLEEIRLNAGSVLCDKALREVSFSKNFGLIVIGIIRSTSEVRFNPGPDTMLREGDDLILFGSNDQLKQLRKVADGFWYSKESGGKKQK